MLQKFSTLIICLLLAGCSVYRSPERKEFESEASQFRVQNLKQVRCSGRSLRSKSMASRLITVYQTPSSPENRFLWEYIIAEHSYFESDNLGGQYCVFEKD